MGKYTKKPYKSNKKAITKRKSYPNTFVRNIPVLFGNSVLVKLRYSLTSGMNMTSVSSAIDVQNLRANSVYDPDQTGAGNQPRNVYF